MKRKAKRRLVQETRIVHHKRGTATVTHKPRQSRLPGMEDSQIKDLEDAAIEHSECASELVAKRAELKSKKEAVTLLMKHNGKTTYNRAGIRLKLRPGHDDVSIQVKRHERQAGE